MLRTTIDGQVVEFRYGVSYHILVKRNTGKV